MRPPRTRAAVIALPVALVLALWAPAALAATSDDGRPDQISNGDFEGNPPRGWWSSGATWTPEGDNACMNVAGGLAAYEQSLIGQNNLTMEAGAEYEFRFRASSTVPDHDIALTFQIDDASRGYPRTISGIAVLGPQEQEFSFTGVATEDSANANLTFQFGGQAVSSRVCLSEVALLGGTPPAAAIETPAIRVNQVGYLPGATKLATYVTEATDPVGWELLDADGAVVASGQTTPHGLDSAAGQEVQLIDFSGYRTPGQGYSLRVGEDISFPFAVDPGIYDQLAIDALRFFYHQRSGEPIDAQYVGDAWARPAGHDAAAPGGGDSSVTCRNDACDYSLDVTGGWYDAGDHGKYVVNGGIAAWQLLWVYERAAQSAGESSPWLADGTLDIPESGNGVADVLDEARHEVEFLLAMQVPQGEELAGMVHHKIHDEAWTGMLTMPDQDTEPRLLSPPSTAATLNMAAVAAQAARIWAEIDPGFADTALQAAESAYAAALAHPREFASSLSSQGGGPYNDNNLEDEFLWAAAELFTTTGEQTYLDDIGASELFVDGTDAVRLGGFGWQNVGALGLIRLALTPSELPEADREHASQTIIDAADALVGVLENQGYRLPYQPGGLNYVWGSNGQLLNSASVLLAAHDLTGGSQYTGAALEAMDYVLGRNALGISYVTGYGSYYAQNQHHRFWANQLDASRPHPPAGSLAGGPNSAAATQDPVSGRSLADCAPQTCYLDDHGAYSVNEVTINWNSALAVVATALADEAGDFQATATTGPTGTQTTGTPSWVTWAAGAAVLLLATAVWWLRRRRVQAAAQAP